MKMREQIEQLRDLNTRHREALRYTVLGMVDWSERKFVSTSGGMPPKMLRVGLMRSTDPYVIVHHVDAMDVFVLTPYQVAQWPWPTVRAFAGLEAFLRKHALPEGPVNVHVPSGAWLRAVEEGKTV